MLRAFLPLSYSAFPSTPLLLLWVFVCFLTSTVPLSSTRRIKESRGGKLALIKCQLSVRHYTRYIPRVSGILNKHSSYFFFFTSSC